jgi:hypothetical protein
MASGWDNHPEYGGPKPTRLGMVAIVLVILVLGALVVCALRR